VHNVHHSPNASATSAATYNVVVAAVPSSVANEDLATALGMSPGTASQIRDLTPATVRRRVSFEVAQSIAERLRELGVSVELEPSDGPASLPRDRAGGVPRRTGPPVEVFSPGLGPAPVIAAAAVEASRDPAQEFWTRLGASFLLPLRRGGLSWMMHGVGVAFAVILSMTVGLVLFPFNLVFVLATLAVLVATCARFFGACVVASIDDVEGPEAPYFDDIKSEYMMPGLILCITAGCAFAPALFLGDITTFSRLMLFAAPVIYWPMGLLRVAYVGSVASFFEFGPAIRGAMSQPARYLFVVFIGIMSIVVLYMILNGIFASMQSSVLTLMLFFVPYMLAVVYAHGVMGAQMGLLLRMDPRVLGETLDA